MANASRSPSRDSPPASVPFAAKRAAEQQRIAMIVCGDEHRAQRIRSRRSVVSGHLDVIGAGHAAPDCERQSAARCVPKGSSSFSSSFVCPSAAKIRPTVSVADAAVVLGKHDPGAGLEERESEPVLIGRISARTRSSRSYRSSRAGSSGCRRRNSPSRRRCPRWDRSRHAPGCTSWKSASSWNSSFRRRPSDGCLTTAFRRSVRWRSAAASRCCRPRSTSAAT